MQGIAIRSLKTDALLLDNGARGHPAFKVSYFGYAKHDTSAAMTIASPLLYAAPEVLGYDQYDPKVTVPSPSPQPELWPSQSLCWLLTCAGLAGC